jgi:hypothetical protein
VLFAEVVNYYFHTASEIDEWMCMEQWWNDIDGRKKVLGVKPTIDLSPPQIPH